MKPIKIKSKAYHLAIIVFIVYLILLFFILKNETQEAIIPCSIICFCIAVVILLFFGNEIVLTEKKFIIKNSFRIWEKTKIYALENVALVIFNYSKTESYVDIYLRNGKTIRRYSGNIPCKEMHEMKTKLEIKKINVELKSKLL